jgi:hypothetical protein
MPNISLSPTFFVNELRAYADWKGSFFRELIQNAVDANCRRINITLEERDGLCVVTFHDDGPGMSAEILTDVYFVVGETTKTGPDTIGGFGRARILTCFGHQAWRIHTNEWLCSGSGSQYEIAQAETKHPGCLVEVTISLAKVDEMETALNYYLQNCQLSCEVSVNGKPFTDWAYRNRLTGKLSFGDVYLNKSKARYSTLVRVNGAHMFARYTQAARLIVVEIDPKRSREILTSNRDGFTSAAARELDDFIGSIWVNPMSAVRSRYQRTRSDYGAPVHRVSKKAVKARQEKDESRHEHSTEKALDETPTFVRESVDQPPAYTTVYENPSGAETTSSYSSSSAGDVYSSFGEAQKRKQPVRGYVLAVECYSRPLQAAAKTFRPENIGGTRLKLLNKWTEFCDMAAEEFAQLEDETFEFRTGFTFVEDDLANCSRSDGVGDLLLCPVRANGKLAYKISSKEDMAKLLAIAAHEVVHLSYGSHDERYARALTMLLGRLLGRSTNRNR